MSDLKDLQSPPPVARAFMVRHPIFSRSDIFKERHVGPGGTDLRSGMIDPKDPAQRPAFARG